MRTFLLLLIVVVVVRAGFHLRRLRDEEADGMHSRGRIAQAAYLAAVLAFCAYHADWLPFYGVVLVLGLCGYAWLLIGMIFAAWSVTGYPVYDSAFSRSFAMVVMVTLLGVVPVMLSVPAPVPPPRPTGLAADPLVREFGGDIDLIVPERDLRLVERAGPPRLADAKVERGEAVPVQQYLIIGKRLFLVVTRSRDCQVEAVVVGRDGAAAAVTVVAQPWTPASLAPSGSARSGSGQPGSGRCGVDGERTMLRLELAEPITSLTDAGAGGPAVQVLR